MPFVDNVASHQKIALHNPFNILDVDSDLPLGEAREDENELDDIVEDHKKNMFTKNVNLIKEASHSAVIVVNNDESHQDLTLHNSFNVLNVERELPWGRR